MQGCKSLGWSGCWRNNARNRGNNTKINHKHALSTQPRLRRMICGPQHRFTVRRSLPTSAVIDSDTYKAASSGVASEVAASHACRAGSFKSRFSARCSLGLPENG
ncbi:hypothetical protein VTK56DRAFT_10124 [Thermocarpiscus australiensis]